MDSFSDFDKPATKHDVEDIVSRTVENIVRRIVGDVVGRAVEDIVGRTVGEIMSDGFQLISEQLATKADKSDITRLENKLDATIEDVAILKFKWRQQFGAT